MANLALNVIGSVARQSRRRFVQQTQHTEARQAAFLRSLLQINQDTSLGQALGLPGMKTVADFRKQVPISRYSDYEPYVERAFQGEANVITPEPIVYFSLTSGSTGKQKILPITKRSRRAVSQANQVAIGFAAHAAKRDRRPLGKMLYTNSARPYGQSPQGIAYGPISVGDLNLMGALYRQVFAHPLEVLKAEKNLTRNYLALLFALRDRHLGIVSATFPVYALSFCEYLERHAESLIDDVRTGTIAPWLELEPELRDRLERQWQPDAKRAAELQSALDNNGSLRPKDAWHDLSFIVTARGGTSNFYLERFPDYFGDTPVFGGIYASAEATYGVHRDFGTDGVILAINSGFYEFIPEAEWEKDQPATVLPHELNVGDRYRILVTALNGLYRYDIGDVVEVEGFFNSAPIVTFRHRIGGILSSTTEKTNEFHVVQVMQRLQQEFDVALENFCITLAPGEIPPPYVANIELAPRQQLSNPEHFLRRFDELLCEMQVSYNAKRPDIIPSPALKILASGSFAQIRQRMVERGMLESQIKLPKLTGDRHYLDGLSVEQEVRTILQNH
ncbi:MAG: GH3 auxin-responsive promoter family protein [Cyanobacteria bacterium J06638_20]